MGPRTLAVRLDSDGDVLLTGPAVRALAAGSRTLDLLVSPSGAQAAALLPGVDDVHVVRAPWSGQPAPPVDGAELEDLLRQLSTRRYDEAVIFTSYHQSPLPMALLARLAGVRRISAFSDDYPGSLLDVRARRCHDGDDDGGPRGGHEVEAALRLAGAAGFVLPRDDDTRLRVKPVPCHVLETAAPYVVVHPVASAPSRSLDLRQAAAAVTALRADGWEVVVTGSADQRTAGAALAAVGAVDLVGATTYAHLAGVLAGASCLVAGNTGPAHLAAAVGTPVVSLFSPVVPPERWAPWGVPFVLLGDQEAACRQSRATTCPVAGHPCLADVDADEVVEAVRTLTGSRRPGHPAPRPTLAGGVS